MIKTGSFNKKDREEKKKPELTLDFVDKKPRFCYDRNAIHKPERGFFYVEYTDAGRRPYDYG